MPCLQLQPLQLHPCPQLFDRSRGVPVRPRLRLRRGLRLREVKATSGGMQRTRLRGLGIPPLTLRPARGR
jgi:hypothetical protein